VASLLFLATVINYLDRQTLSLLAPMLRDSFGISATGYSHIIFAFLAAYMIMQAGSGRMMDRMGTRRGFAVTIAFWSAAAMLHAAAASAASFAAARFLLGLGEAGNWPGSIKAISEWFPAKERGVAIGFFNSGSIVGALIAPMVIPWLALSAGWRAAFLFTGALGFLWLVPWLLFYRRPEEHPRITSRELALIREDAAGET
jgi:ACS family hexuronate transporter-like MFS transporter